jgi:DNA (cytosine-5)-methyltransferase 1
MRESAAGPVRELALFAGAGGGILGGELLGWKTVCAVEIERDCQERLLQRQREGFLPFFPIWDDVKTFDGRPWRGCVDIVSGGFPCTDISAAGKGDGIEGAESGLWKEMARICRDVRPRYVWIENSPLLTIRGLAVVLWDIAAMGLDAEWCVVSSADAGGSSLRERIWILAYTAGEQDERKGQRGFQPESSQCYSDVANGESVRRGEGRAESEGEQGRPDAFVRGELGDTDRAGLPERGQTGGSEGEERDAIPHADAERPGGPRETVEPRLGGDSHGLASWMDAFASRGRPPVAGRGPEQFPWEPPRTCKGGKDRAKRIRAIGNGQDPWALALAWKILRERAKA